MRMREFTLFSLHYLLDITYLTLLTLYYILDITYLTLLT